MKKIIVYMSATSFYSKWKHLDQFPIHLYEHCFRKTLVINASHTFQCCFVSLPDLLCHIKYAFKFFMDRYQK